MEMVQGDVILVGEAWMDHCRWAYFRCQFRESSRLVRICEDGDVVAALVD